MFEETETLDTSRELLSEDRQGEAYSEQITRASETDKQFYIESYGCQMNFNDSEIVASILQDIGYSATDEMEAADLILINTCSIREKAEETVRQRLRVFDKVKEDKPGTLVGVLGCMAERLKDKLLEQEKLVDLVVGPDAYRDLPKLVSSAERGDRAVNVFLSREETYADISPVRLDSSGVSGFISIMRGCDNMCSFCVVPFTRGRERSRNAYSIVAEATDLYEKGYREVTLLGQNVDSYKWNHPETEEVVTFADLLVMIAEVSPDLRVRFSTSHPKDITGEVLYAIRDYKNICNYIHLPVQSGSSRILELMNRGYDREWYKDKVRQIYEVIPDCAVSSDIIAGFCTETEDDHRKTLDMIEWANYSMSYMFYYSERPNTLAERQLEDDIPLDVKKRRLQEIIRLQHQVSYRHNQNDIGKTFEVLIEGYSKKSDKDYCGRNSQNKMIVFPVVDGYGPGDYVQVEVEDATSATLMGTVVE